MNNYITKLPDGRIKYSVKNLWLMPVFFILPYDMAVRGKVEHWPRNLSILLNSPEYCSLIETDQFFNLMVDFLTELIWPYFKTRGSLKSYSERDPIYLLAIMTPNIIKFLVKNDHIIGNNELMTYKVLLDFIPKEIVDKSLSVAIADYISENNLQPIIDTVAKIRCFEDFAPVKPIVYDGNHEKFCGQFYGIKLRSRAYIDFERKWHHTCTKIKTISLEEYTEKRHNNVITNNDGQFEERVCSRIEANRFMDTLDDTDRQILEMRISKIPYQEIADRLGFKTHSAVIKRIRRIGEKYLDFVGEQK